MSNTKLYFCFGDNMNAKNLYFYCKKRGKKYPFSRAAFKALLPDHKLCLIAKDEKSRYGIISVEESIGHVVPGIVFEVIDDADLSIFSSEFEEVKVAKFDDGTIHTVLINKREKQNVMDLVRMKRIQFSKNRKKILRKAIQWRNLENFEACFDSAVCNVNYPHMIRSIYLTVDQLNYFDALYFDDYNHIEIGEGNGISVNDGEEIVGILIRVLSNRVINLLRNIDSRLKERYTRSVVELINTKELESIYAWMYV